MASSWHHLLPRRSGRGRRTENQKAKRSRPMLKKETKNQEEQELLDRPQEKQADADGPQGMEKEDQADADGLPEMEDPWHSVPKQMCPAETGRASQFGLSQYAWDVLCWLGAPPILFNLLHSLPVLKGVKELKLSAGGFH